MFTPQVPLGSGFTAFSTVEDVVGGVDLTSKIAMVTGGYSGLGRETVRVFLAAGAHVFVLARDVARARTALGEVSGAEILPLDLANQASIEDFSDQFLGLDLPLHILVNSSGIMAQPELARDARGHELQFTTNHLGHCQLTLRLWPALVKAQGARVVWDSSKAHRFSPVVFEDVHFKRRPYDPWVGYGQSKTANILFALRLDDLGGEDGIRAFALHPGGIIETGLARHLPVGALQTMGVQGTDGRRIIDPARDLKTIPHGAATQAWCATSQQLDGLGGVCCENSDIVLLRQDEPKSESPVDNSPTDVGVLLPHALDRAAAAKLWAVSDHLLGIRAT